MLSLIRTSSAGADRMSSRLGLVMPRSSARQVLSGGFFLGAQTAGAEGLDALLQKRSGRDLTSPIFNIPPKQQVYPDWLEGNWSVRSRFVGFEFPTLPRQQVLWVGRNQQEDVPGFKTCSIIDFADVGKSPLEYNMSFVKRSTDGGVVEDWPSNLCSTVQAHLARGRVTSVDYSPSQDPNRLTMRLVASKNAERVELFVNARDAERPKEPGRRGSVRFPEDVFLCSEYRRCLGFVRPTGSFVPRGQVTFSSRVQQGYNCNYQHYRTFQRQADGVRLNVLTASYLDPLSPLYFESFDKPVVVFAHELQLSRAEAVAACEDPSNLPDAAGCPGASDLRCDLAPVRPKAVLAQFVDQGNFLLVAFDAALAAWNGTDLGEEIPCSEFFTPTTVAELGDRAACIQGSPQHLLVRLGFGASLGEAATAVFVLDTARQYQQINSPVEVSRVFEFPAQRLFLGPALGETSNFVKPTVILTLVGCALGGPSVGALRRPWKLIRWRCTGDGSSCAKIVGYLPNSCDQQTPLETTGLAVGPVPCGLRATIPEAVASDLTISLATLEIHLKLENAMGLWDEAVHRIRFTVDRVPMAVALSDPAMTVDEGSSVRLELSVGPALPVASLGAGSSCGALGPVSLEWRYSSLALQQRPVLCYGSLLDPSQAWPSLTNTPPSLIASLDAKTAALEGTLGDLDVPGSNWTLVARVFHTAENAAPVDVPFFLMVRPQPPSIKLQAPSEISNTCGFSVVAHAAGGISGDPYVTWKCLFLDVVSVTEPVSTECAARAMQARGAVLGLPALTPGVYQIDATLDDPSKPSDTIFVRVSATAGPQVRILEPIEPRMLRGDEAQVRFRARLEATACGASAMAAALVVRSSVPGEATQLARPSMVLATKVMNFSQDVQPDDNFEGVSPVARLGARPQPPLAQSAGAGASRNARVAMALDRTGSPPVATSPTVPKLSPSASRQSLSSDVSSKTLRKASFLGPDDNSEVHAFTLKNFIYQDRLPVRNRASSDDSLEHANKAEAKHEKNKEAFPDGEACLCDITTGQSLNSKVAKEAKVVTMGIRGGAAKRVLLPAVLELQGEVRTTFSFLMSLAFFLLFSAACQMHYRTYAVHLQEKNLRIQLTDAATEVNEIPQMFEWMEQSWFPFLWSAPNAAGTTESLLPSRQLTLLGGSLHLGVEGEEEESVRGVELRNSALEPSKPSKQRRARARHRRVGNLPRKARRVLQGGLEGLPSKKTKRSRHGWMRAFFERSEGKDRKPEDARRLAPTSSVIMDGLPDPVGYEKASVTVIPMSRTLGNVSLQLQAWQSHPALDPCLCELPAEPFRRNLRASPAALAAHGE
eukprot:g9235.t1